MLPPRLCLDLFNELLAPRRRHVPRATAFKAGLAPEWEAARHVAPPFADGTLNRGLAAHMKMVIFCCGERFCRR